MATFTIYPDTTDGFVESTDTVYLDAARLAGGLSANTVASTIIVGQFLVGGTDFYCWESFLNFDIPAGIGTVTSAVLSLVPQNVQTADQVFTVEASR